MVRWAKSVLALAAVALGLSVPVRAGNPIVPGWYADPELHVFAGAFWLYPTLSVEDRPDRMPILDATQRTMRSKAGIRPAFLTQTHVDAFSSRDLVHWIRHPHILDTAGVRWAAYALWAPSVIAANNHYYLFFGANDVHPGEIGGLGVATSPRPGGPFRDALGKPLIGEVHHGAQPIDPFVFRDDDGSHYLFYGGWGHCNVVRLADDLIHLLPFPDGTTYREITPPGYVEGSFMLKRNGTYYFMWSEGDWTGPDYRVAYATGPTALGPFTPRGTILSQDLTVARGAGHHSVLRVPSTNDWLIAYHRRPLTEANGDHRVLAVERLSFNSDGTIAPVRMTDTGVAYPLSTSATPIHR